MAVGWTNVDGTEYYFNESHDNEPNWYETGDGFYESYNKKVIAYGSLLTNTTAPDGRKVDGNGRLLTTKNNSTSYSETYKTNVDNVEVYSDKLNRQVLRTLSKATIVNGKDTKDTWVEIDYNGSVGFVKRVWLIKIK